MNILEFGRQKVPEAWIWSPLVRGPLVIVFFMVGYLFSKFLPIISVRSNFHLVLQTLGQVAHANIENVANPDFAFALACEITSVAFALAFAFLFTHVLVVRLFLWRAKRRLAAYASPLKFEENFDKISQEMSNDDLLGNAWDAFAKTYVRDKLRDRTIHFATARPQGFFNAGVAREHLFGLKLMPSIPGYFVGLGLLLTFIGLVIALSKASHTTGVSVDEMSHSLGELLNAATFKFSTSIAGLFSSLALSLIFKSYSIWIEFGFDSFCRTLEKRLTFITPQALAVKAWHAQTQQLHQLQEMNTAQYFERLGQAISPSVGGAISEAVYPLTEKFEASIQRMEQISQTGTAGLMEDFSKAIHGGAGRELQELSSVLAQTTEALQGVQGRLSGSGDDFSKQISEATEKFAKLVAETSERFSASNESGRAAMDQVLRALTQAAEDSKRQMHEGASQVGRDAAARMDENLREIQRQAEAHMGAFQSAITAFQQTVGTEAEAATTRSREASAAAAAAAARAANDSSAAIKSGVAETSEAIRKELGGVIAALRSDLERMSASFKASEAALTRQTEAARSAVEQSNAVAQSFRSVANDVSTASRPLLEASGRIAGATEEMSKAVGVAAASLTAGQAAARALAEGLTKNQTDLNNLWSSYADKFDKVDVSLANSIRTLAEETTRHQKSIEEFVAKLDEHLAQAVRGLAGTAGSLEENTTEIGEIFENFITKLSEIKVEEKV